MQSRSCFLLITLLLILGIPTQAVDAFHIRSWTDTGSMQVARRGHQLAVLKDGRVLAVGGVETDEDLFSAELYDPSSGSWERTEDLHNLYASSALTLNDGDVFVVGYNPTSSRASVAIFNPTNELWSYKSNPATEDVPNEVEILADGRVIAFFFTSVEIYDSQTDSWSTAASPRVPRGCYALCELSMYIFDRGQSAYVRDVLRHPVSAVDGAAAL